MTRSLLTLAVITAACLAPQLAQAHFLWMVSEKGSEGTAVKLSLSEGPVPEASDAKYLSKIAAAKVVSRVTGKDASPVSLREQSRGETGTLEGQSPAQKPVAFDGSIDYGVMERNGKAFLIKYYARTIAADSAESFEKLARGTVDLDIVPRRDGDQLELLVLWKGKPLEGAQVMVGVGAGKQEELKTDAKGAVRVTPAAGLYGVRARLIEEGKEGTLGDKKYGEVRHYSTLTFELPGAAE